MRLLTAPGIAGIAVVSCDPAEVAAVLGATGIATDLPWALASAPAPRRAVLRLANRELDEVLLVARRDGTLEMHLHGSPAVLAALASRFAVVRDVAGTAAERLLRGALGPEQLALGLEQVAPGFAVGLAGALARPLDQRDAELAAALARSQIAKAMVTPARVALVGRQNAGKSTLFNSLLQRERVLVGPRPGLTRDPVSEVTILDGYPYELVDTAGEGEAASELDRAAIAEARAQHDGALTMLVIDAAAGLADSDRAFMAAATLVVASKVDLPGAARAAAGWPRAPDALVSALAAEPGATRRELGLRLRVARGLPPAGAVGGFAALDEAEQQQLLAAMAAR